MVTEVRRSPQSEQGVLSQQSGSSNELFRIAAQFLANTPVPKTREAYGRELGFFISWYRRNGTIANVTFEDLLRYKVMLYIGLGILPWAALAIRSKSMITLLAIQALIRFS